MKTRTKQCGVFAALAVVLLVTAALITSCLEPIEFGGFAPQEAKEVPFTPPPGMGFIQVDLGGSSNIRTIRPDTSGFAVGTFAKYDVAFTPVGTGTAVTQNGITYATLTAPIVVVQGTYNVAVWAYDNALAAARTEAVAYGMTASTITVSSAGVGTGSIALKELVNGAGEGTFTLNLTNASANPATAVSLTIMPYPTGTAVVDNLGVTSTLTTYSVDLDSGYYRIQLELSRSGAKTIVLEEALHIYQGLTSTYAAALPALSNNVYTISFTYNDTRTPDPETTTVVHGDLITEPSGTTIDHFGSPTLYALEGWYTKDGTGNDWGDKWVFASGYPIRNTPLFAKWESTGVTLTITLEYSGANPPTFTITDFTSGDPVNSGTTISRTSPPKINIAIGTGYSDITWAATTTDLSAETGATITLDFNDLDLLLAGGHRITVFATHTATSQPESSSVTFTVAND